MPSVLMVISYTYVVFAKVASLSPTSAMNYYVHLGQ